MTDKQAKTAQLIIGAFILLLALSLTWYYFYPKSIPAVIVPAPGKPAVPTPGKIPDAILNAPPATNLGTAYAKYETSVFKKDFSLYKKAKPDEWIGKITGTSGVWSIVNTPGGPGFVYTDSIYSK